ncbi:MAG TPA: cupin domain-containing protein [Chthoniobacterales bacterium]
MTILRDPLESQLRAFGAHLRELRSQRGWTLDELARRSGLSSAFLSRLESGDRQASIAAVLTLARVFRVSLSSMFEPPFTAEPCLIVRAADAAPQTADGLTYASLSDADRFFNLQPLRVTVSPTREGSDHFQHEGEEWIYVLSGQLTLSLAGQTHELEPGDSAHFNSWLPHRLIARGSREAELLLVASPLSEPGGRSRRPAFRERRAIPACGRARG